MKVVFHADDFGLTHAVNAGILEAHAGGLLASTSLMVTAAAAEDAVAAARAHPGLDVGLHLTLVEERPVLPPERIPSLVAGGRFLPRHTRVALRYAAGGLRVEEAAAEIAAQFERLAAWGIRPSHVDGHQHLHLLPALLPVAVAQARRSGARFVRTRLVNPGGGPLVRRAQLAALALVARRARARLGAAAVGGGAFVTIGFAEAGGALTTERLLASLDRLRGDPRAAVVEVMLHPGRRDADTERRYGHWGYRWEQDLALLLDARLPGALAERGIEVTSFRDL